MNTTNPLLSTTKNKVLFFDTIVIVRAEHFLRSIKLQ